MKSRVILTATVAAFLLLISGCSLTLKQPAIEQQKNKPEIEADNERINKTSAQQSYREMIGFEINIPQDWECKSETGAIVAERMTYCGPRGEAWTNVLTIIADKTKPGRGAVEYIKEFHNGASEILGAKIPAEPNYEIAGTKGVRVDYLEGGYDIDPISEGFTVCFVKNNRTVLIYAHLDSEGKLKQTVEKILDSIKIE